MAVTHDKEKSSIGTETAAAGVAPRGRETPSVSIIIPAHDEAVTLPACLQSVLKQDYPRAMRVIVVDNGSSDGTAEAARRWTEQFVAAGHELIVLELARGNKCAALNVGDFHATGDCRIYLDADTEISPNCVSRVTDALTNGGGVGLCSPQIRLAQARSWATRRYGRVWSRLPWVSNDVIGAGFYAVSSASRRRWGEFPDLLSEDTFAQAQFHREERLVLPDATFLVRLPEGFFGLIKVRTRWLTGNRQLARRVRGEWGRAAFPFRARIRFLLSRPSLWPDLPLYVLINLCALWRVRRREALGTIIWERARPETVDALDDAEPAAWPPGA